MGKFVPLHGFGGGSDSSSNSLNFKIIGSTTEPTNPKENTIWINTDVEITSWIFSATEPVGTPGKVWFKTDISSNAEFNALKNNEILVYPTVAKQYINGVWTHVTTMTYQNGNWAEWVQELYLYNAPDTCDAASGGWYADSQGLRWGGTSTRGYIDFLSDRMSTYGKSGSYMGALSTKNKINLSSYTELKAIASVNTSNSVTTMRVCSALGDISANAIATTQINNYQSEITIDISDIDEGYIVFCSDVYEVRVYKVWLVP